jgi:DNA (cytosine-5)-methyltransferase 1
MKTAVSLFSGCGGSDLGIARAGFTILMANDTLAYAKDVYQANHSETDYKLGDIRKVKHFPGADLLIGCYPCQGFSQGGVRDPNRRINTLYLEFARALAQMKPKAFIVENVSGMVRTNYRHLLLDQIKVFSELGYNVRSALLNAADYGVAQERKRILIVGTRRDLNVDFHFPKATHGDGTRKPYQTIKEALRYMRHWPSEDEYYKRDFHWYYLSRDRRRDWSELSKTIVANPRHMPLHPISPVLRKVRHNVWEFENNEPARRFTYREAARLQGFDSDFKFPDTTSGSLDMRYKVVGNAVPPPLFNAVVTSLPKSIW